MPEDVIKVQEQYYILASSALADDRTRVLKNGETFAVFDRFGDIHHVGLGEQGIFHEGTRYMDRLVLRVDHHRPLLLSSTLKEDNAVLTVDLTNPDISANGSVAIPRGTLHIYRSKFLWHGVCYEALRCLNFGLAPLEVWLSLRFDADFADIFEVRGVERHRHGRRLENRLEDGAIVLPYEGLDGVRRWTRIGCHPRPEEITPGSMRFHLCLEAKQEAEYVLTIACESDACAPARLTYPAALVASTDNLNALMEHDCRIYTANEQFNDWVHRSVSDLHMMVTNAPGKLYPYAGVPWFSTVFGRDGLVTAFQYLWVNPLIAAGVLRYLSHTQAAEEIPAQDAEPGKILHEERGGEMAALGEHPFRRYYGSIDATPLFVALAGAYYRRTGDLQLIHEIWGNLERALSWIDRYGDCDGDGFVEYAKRSKNGLVQQGWKDSHDSVFHADGRLAEPPIALCEVQAYVYVARRSAAALAAALGLEDRAREYRRQAEALRDRFERDFWSDDLGCYVLALDGAKRPCLVRTSNAGHCLFTGIASQEHAERTAETLLSSDLFSGWGIRTLAANEVRYNPMSYHNGSIWPHDNSLIAIGLARYGLHEYAARIMTGLFDAALFIDQHRLPELFCGFGRRPGQGPTLYPVACSPQAWASGAAFLLLQACLGLSIDAPRREVRFRYANLPEFLPELVLKNLWVGDANVDLRLERHRYSVGVMVLRREGKLDVLAVK